MEITIKLAGALQLVRGRQQDSGERSDRVLFIGGQMFASNPKDFPPGDYTEITGTGEYWGDQKGLRLRIVTDVKPIKAPTTPVKAA